MTVIRSETIHVKVIELIDEIIAERKSELVALPMICESPIEQLLVAALLEECWNSKEYAMFVIPQFEIGKYRVDFMVFLATHAYLNKDDNRVPVRVVVECDGHEFHEKTKQQAARDKSRDRDLQREGYAVMHFTGSEIWKDPRKCAKEVTEMLYAKVRESGNV